MKQNIIFAASSLIMLRKPYRWMFTVVILMSILVTLGSSAKAQSKDRDNPTRITSNVISGELSTDTTGDNYHYSFVAGAGEVTLTLSVESGGSVNQVSYDLFDEDAKRIGGKIVTTLYGED